MKILLPVVKKIKIREMEIRDSGIVTPKSSRLPIPDQKSWMVSSMAKLIWRPSEKETSDKLVQGHHDLKSRSMDGNTYNDEYMDKREECHQTRHSKIKSRPD